MPLLFVYGSLKRGGENHGQMLGQRFLAPARTAPGLTLYNLDGYPGMVPAAADTAGVTGELWFVDDARLAHLDAFEGLAEGLYRRDQIALQTPATTEPVWTYFYARSVAGRAHLGAEWKV